MADDHDVDMNLLFPHEACRRRLSNCETRSRSDAVGRPDRSPSLESYRCFTVAISARRGIVAPSPPEIFLLFNPPPDQFDFFSLLPKGGKNCFCPFFWLNSCGMAVEMAVSREILCSFRTFEDFPTTKRRGIRDPRVCDSLPHAFIRN